MLPAFLTRNGATLAAYRAPWRTRELQEHVPPSKLGAEEALLNTPLQENRRLGPLHLADAGEALCGQPVARIMLVEQCGLQLLKKQAILESSQASPQRVHEAGAFKKSP